MIDSTQETGDPHATAFAPPPALASAPAQEAPVRNRAGQPRPRLWLRVTLVLWNWIVGSAACLTLPSSIFVVGWTFRLMRRSAVRNWNRLANVELLDSGPVPGWVLRERGPRGVRNLLAPLWLNAKLGLQGVFNAYVLTFPACLLWLFAWRFGWDNSFHKMYEQSFIGPSTWMLGNAAFIAAMLYLPLAQARQAVTGDWRAFYGFRLVWALLRRRPIRWLLLAAGYSLFSVPIYILMWAPQLFAQNEMFESMSDEQIVGWLYRYYFFGSLLLLPCYVALRLLATRLYAKALPSAVRRGEVRLDQLHNVERETLGPLGLLRVDPPMRRHPVVRAVGWTGGRIGRIAIGSAAVLLWATVALQIALASFLSYSHQRWLIQPLVQIPTITLIPSHLTDPPAPRDATDMGASMTGA